MKKAKTLYSDHALTLTCPDVQLRPTSPSSIFSRRQEAHHRVQKTDAVYG